MLKKMGRNSRSEMRRLYHEQMIDNRVLDPLREINRRRMEK